MTVPGASTHTGPSGEWLFPASRGDVHTLFHLLRDALRRELVGHRPEIDRLVLLGTRHLARDLVPPGAPLRALILGPSGSGKSTLLRAFARVLGLPHVLIPGPTMAEMNWSGSDAADFLRQLYEGVVSPAERARAADLAERAVVVIDGVDALRLPGRYASASTRDYQLGRQRSLLPLVGDGVIPIERGSRSASWPSRRALVIASGVFPGLKVEIPGAEDLADWGLIPEVADRLASGTVLRLSGPTREDLPVILEQGLDGVKEAFALFGYRLSVSPEAIAFVADQVRGTTHGTGVRGAIGWLTDAAEQVLARLVRDQAPAGTQHMLAPDDVNVVQESRGLWRE